MESKTKALYSQLNAKQFLIDALYIYLTTQRQAGGKPLRDLHRIANEQVRNPNRLPAFSPALENALEFKPEVERLLEAFFREVATLTQTDLSG